MNKKIISLELYKKSKAKTLLKNLPNKLNKIIKMLFFAIVLGSITGLLCWNYFVEDVANLDVKIPQSKNITFNQNSPIAMTTAQVANEFEKADNKPIILYIYTTWCRVCSKNFETINEIAREFQNTDLQIITLAVDRDMNPQDLSNYLNKFGDFYFQPRYLAFKEGFKDFLQKKNINYNNYIPFTVLISRDGEVVTKFSGSKNKNYLRNKIIKELYL